MRVSVSLGLWQDRPADEAVMTAVAADELGYPEVWVGEMATYDAFALATAIGLATKDISLTVGPLAVAVRDPMMIAMGVASVADLTGRHVDVAVGTSSPVVVEQWHGRLRTGSGRRLRETVETLRALLDGEKSDTDLSRGYRLRLPATRSEVTVAAFGPEAVRTAALADRMVLNLITPASAARLITQLHTHTPQTPDTSEGVRSDQGPREERVTATSEGARSDGGARSGEGAGSDQSARGDAGSGQGGRENAPDQGAREGAGSSQSRQGDAGSGQSGRGEQATGEGAGAGRGARTAVWVTAAVNPDREAIERIRRGIVGYLAAPGYGEMFAEAGFGDVVEYARTTPHPRDLLKAIPDALLHEIALIGDVQTVKARMKAYDVDEIALVPVSTDADPGGVRTLKLLAD